MTTENAARPARGRAAGSGRSGRAGGADRAPGRPVRAAELARPQRGSAGARGGRPQVASRPGGTPPRGRGADFAEWRRHRPFLGSVVSIVGAIEIYAATQITGLDVFVQAGLPAWMTLVLSALTIVMGVVTLRQPELRSITGWVIIVFGLMSILLTNLGGFVVGMLLLITGGGLILAWEALEDPMGAGAPSGGQRTGMQPSATAVLPPSAGGPEPDVAIRGGHGTSGGPAVPDDAPRMPEPMTGSTSSGIAVDDEARPAGGAPRILPGSDVAFGKLLVVIPLILSLVVVPGLSVAPAHASATAPTQSGIFDWLDWLFPPATPDPAPVPALPTAPEATAPATAPSAVPVPAGTPSPAAGAPASGTAPGSAPAASVPVTPGAMPTSPTTGAAATCPAESTLPDGRTAMGSDESLAVADAMRDCAAVQSAQLAAGEEIVTSQATDGGVPLVSGKISTLNAKALILNGLSYDGIVSLDSPQGPIEVLQFSADQVEVEQMVQTYPFGNGNQVTIQDRSGKATIKGNVKLYVTKMSGKIFGLVPLTFTPDFPPPIIVPFLIITEAVADAVFVQADSILVPRINLPVS